MLMIRSLLLAAVLAPFLAVATPAKAQQSPAAIAVVNISQVSQKLDAKKDADREMEALSSSLNQERQKLEADAENLKKELGAYAINSEPYRQTMEKMMRKGLEMESFRAYSQEKLLMEQRLRTMAMYRSINKAVADYAKANNILLVLVADDDNLEGTRSMQELMAKVTVRKVMYASEKLDISTAIIEKMNTEARTGAAPK